MCRPLALLLIGVFLLSYSPPAAAQQCRPCGPDSLQGPLRMLIPQGAAGASFKSACRMHDACYAQPGVDKRVCDRQFLDDLYCACGNARNPRKCRRRAQKFYQAVVRWGDGSFESTIWRLAEGSARRTSKPPISRARGTMMVSMLSRLVGSEWLTSIAGFQLMNISSLCWLASLQDCNEA